MPFLGVPLLGREGTGFITIAGTAPSPPLPPVVLAPVITSPDTDAGVAGASYQYQIVATNNPTSFAATNLPAGLTINATGRISGTLPATAGTHTIGLEATNAGGTGHRNLDLTVTSGLQAPVINSPATHTAQVGQPFGYTITATHNPTNFAATNLPAGLSVNATTGAITGLPTATVTGYVIGLEATNAAGTGHQNLTVTINPATPVVTNPGAQTWHIGTAITDIHVSASNSPTSYAATNLPTGVTIAAATGIISGTPATGTTLGARTIGLTAINAGGTSALVNMSVNVLPAVPVVAPGQSVTVAIGSAISPNYQIVASNSPTSFTRTSGTLPAGLSMSAAGVISGTPTPGSTTVGTHAIHVTATNAGGTSPAVSLDIHLTAQPLPAVTAASLTRIVGYTAFTHQIVATNPPIVSYSLSGQPVGVTVNTTSGLITGTNAVSLGPHTFTMHATNHTGQSIATNNFTLTVDPVPIPVVTPASLTRTEGTAWTHQIVATNLTYTPISYSISGQPAGVTVNTTTGVISGTAAVAEGTHHITMHCTNAGGQSLGATLEVIIGPPAVGWQVTGRFPLVGPPPPVPAAFEYNSGKVPLTSFTGWLPAYAADMTDDLYFNAAFTSTANLPVRLYATFTGQTERLIDFDRWPGAPGNGTGRIQEWGFDSGPMDIYLTGFNATGNPIQLRLVKP